MSATGEAEIKPEWICLILCLFFFSISFHLERTDVVSFYSLVCLLLFANIAADINVTFISCMAYE